MGGMLSTYRRMYLTFFAQDNGRMRARFDTVEPTGAGALVAMLTRGKLTRDGRQLEFEIVTDPTKDPALKGPKGDKGDPGAASTVPGPKGDPGQNGTNGTNGADGQSAYQLARSQGYGGTLTQWLASLVGSKGDKGDQGQKGDTGATGPAAATILGSVVLAETSLIGISAGVRRRTIAAGLTLPTNVPLLLLPKAPPPAGYIVQAAWAASTTNLTVDLTMPAITVLTSYSIDCWLLRLNA